MNHCSINACPIPRVTIIKAHRQLATEPAFLLQNVDGAIVFSGQCGELAVSFDNGNTWYRARIDGAMIHSKGSTYQYSIFDDYLLKLK